MPPLIVAIAVSAVLEILAEASGRRRAVYVLKPLTTALIIVLAGTLPNPVSNLYRTAIVAGLVFSLAGDVFLMLPADRFVSGLASFLVAHLCYIAAFASTEGPRSVLAGMLLIAWGGFLLGQLWARLGRLRLPVILYAAVLLVMAWTAIGKRAAPGAILFVISDSVLAMERFRQSHRWGRAVVLATYFAAQLLIASSVGTEGLEQSNRTGYHVNVHEITSGVVYKDDRVTVTAFEAHHGSIPAFGYRFDTPDRSIVVAGDGSAANEAARNCRGCDALVEEAYTEASFEMVPPQWQQYRKAFHPSTADVARSATLAKPGILILTHRGNAGCDQIGSQACRDAGSEAQLLKEVRDLYKGKVVAAHDLDVF